MNCHPPGERENALFIFYFNFLKCWVMNFDLESTKKGKMSLPRGTKADQKRENFNQKAPA